MKKITAITIALSMALMFNGCGGKDSSNSNTKPSVSTAQLQPKNAELTRADIGNFYRNLEEKPEDIKALAQIMKNIGVNNEYDVDGGTIDCIVYQGPTHRGYPISLIIDRDKDKKVTSVKFDIKDEQNTEIYFYKDGKYYLNISSLFVSPDVEKSIIKQMEDIIYQNYPDFYNHNITIKSMVRQVDTSKKITNSNMKIVFLAKSNFNAYIDNNKVKKEFVCEFNHDGKMLSTLKSLDKVENKTKNFLADLPRAEADKYRPIIEEAYEKHWSVDTMKEQLAYLEKTGWLSRDYINERFYSNPDEFQYNYKVSIDTAEKKKSLLLLGSGGPFNDAYYIPDSKQANANRFFFKQSAIENAKKNIEAVLEKLHPGYIAHNFIFLRNDNYNEKLYSIGEKEDFFVVRGAYIYMKKELQGERIAGEEFSVVCDRSGNLAMYIDAPKGAQHIEPPKKIVLQNAYVITENVELIQDPLKNSEKLATLKINEKVTAIYYLSKSKINVPWEVTDDKGKKWTKVKFNEKEGYVLSNTLANKPLDIYIPKSNEQLFFKKPGRIEYYMLKDSIKTTPKDITVTVKTISNGKPDNVVNYIFDRSSGWYSLDDGGRVRELGVAKNSEFAMSLLKAMNISL